MRLGRSMLLGMMVLGLGCGEDDGAGAQGGADAGPDGIATDGPPSELETQCQLGPGAGFQRCSANPLVTAHRPFVDGGIEWTQADPTVLYDSDDGTWKAWWSTVVLLDCTNVDQRELHVKYAQSSDGIDWQIQDEPALRGHIAPDDWDYSTSETPSVIHVPGNPPDRRYAMLYAGGNDAVSKVLGQTGWQIGLAFSADGKSFQRLPAAESPYAGASTPFASIDGLVLLAADAFPTTPGVAGGIVADPEVIFRDGSFHLYFSSVAVDAAGTLVPGTYGISHATSPDLVHWTMPHENPIATLQGGGQPTILDDGAELTMWFGQDTDEDHEQVPSAVFPTLGFWKATSTDGVAWVRSGVQRDFVWDPDRPEEDLGLINGAAIARGPDGLRRLYYAAWGTHTQPPGSCVYVWDRSSGTPVLESVPGTHNLLLAVER